MRKETPWGWWDHLSLADTAGLFRGVKAPWWIAGGYAIDAFAGPGRREHDDIDISVFAVDQPTIQHHLSAWELQCADPPGKLRVWLPGEVLAPHIHDIWARRHATDAWRFQVMLNPGSRDEFVFRRDERTRMPLDRATFVQDGIRYLVPELQLLFKAAHRRPKDEQDFSDCLPLLSAEQRTWLRSALGVQQPGHAWLAALA